MRTHRAWHSGGIDRRHGSETGRRGVGNKSMQRGQGPGRGIYVVRRIVAVLVVLLLLVLLVPWAWQNLFSPGEEQGSEAPEIAEVGGTEGGEEIAAEEGSAGGTEEVVVS